MRKAWLCVALVAALLLTGCSFTLGTGNVEELLRAPQANAHLRAVQKALSAYLAEPMQLKYPRGGDETSPILFTDLDGDGTNEAVALYTVESKGQNVHLAVLEPGSDTWEVAYELEGLSTEVASLQQVSFTAHSTQLIIGYANATLTDKYLTVYDYRNDTVTRLLEQGYMHYLAEDLDDDGLSDLLLVTNGAQAGALNLQWLRGGETAQPLAQVQALSLDERFVSCQNLYAVRSGEVRGVVAEGTFATGWLADDVLRLTADRLLVRWPQNDTDVPMVSLRALAVPASVMETGGVLRVPTNVTNVTTLSYSRRFYFITWQDYLQETHQPENQQPEVIQPEAQADQPVITEPEQPCFGVYDALYGYFVRLPEEWRGKVTIADGTGRGDWQIRMREGNRLMAGVRVTDSSRPIGTYTRAAAIGDNSVLIYIGNACTAEEAKLIRTGVTVLEN